MHTRPLPLPLCFTEDHIPAKDTEYIHPTNGTVIALDPWEGNGDILI